MGDEKIFGISECNKAYRFRVLFNRGDETFPVLCREIVNVSVKTERNPLASMGFNGGDIEAKIDLTFRMPIGPNSELFYNELKELLNGHFDMIVESLDGINADAVSPIESMKECSVIETTMDRSYDSINEEDSAPLYLHMKIQSSNYELK